MNFLSFFVSLNSCLLVCFGLKYMISKYSRCVNKEEPVITAILGITITTCVHECSRRTACLALSYNRQQHLCSLYSTEDVTFVSGVCVYIERSDIILEDPCGGQCTAAETCEDQSTECTISECRRLIRPGTELVGNMYNIGSKIKYICNNDYVTNILLTSLECLPDGNWNKRPFCPTNVAYNKPVTMSSQYNEYSSSDKLVNGDITGLWPCASTQWEHRPWMIVDLLSDYRIVSFSLYNRQYCCPGRLHNIEISVGLTVGSLELCVKYPGILDPIVQTFQFYNTPCIGRYVKVQIVNAITEEVILTVCELQVIATEI